MCRLSFRVAGVPHHAIDKMAPQQAVLAQYGRRSSLRLSTVHQRQKRADLVAARVSPRELRSLQPTDQEPFLLGEELRRCVCRPYCDLDPSEMLISADIKLQFVPAASTTADALKQYQRVCKMLLPNLPHTDVLEPSEGCCHALLRDERGARVPNTHPLPTCPAAGARLPPKSGTPKLLLPVRTALAWHALISARSPPPAGGVLGGATFRVLQLSRAGDVWRPELLVLIVSRTVIAPSAQRNGLGSCLVRYLRGLLSTHAAVRKQRALILTQADNNAIDFWRKCGLEPRSGARTLTEALFRWQPREFPICEGARPMLQFLTRCPDRPTEPPTAHKESKGRATRLGARARGIG
jgi:GNAT superfamily N-acetyltransferase